MIEKAWATVRLQSRNAEKIAKLRMEIRLLGTLPKKVLMDADRARQVLQNLLINAVKARRKKFPLPLTFVTMMRLAAGFLSCGRLAAGLLGGSYYLKPQH